MTLIFSLSIECGALGTEGVSQYFQGKGGRYKVNTFQDEESNPWVMILDAALYSNYYRGPKDFFEVLTSKYYQDLKKISFFRYAIVGLEVDEFRTYNELIEDLPTWEYPGLVISNQMVKEIKGVESKFERFNSSHMWIPGWKLD